MDVSDDTKVYMTWTSYKGRVYNLTCSVIDLGFRCPSSLENELIFVSFGELFIGANFTAIALTVKNDASVLDQTRHPELVDIQLGMNDYFPDGFRDNTPAISFPLYPNVQLRATLAMTHRQTLKNKKMAALGLQKVGCDVQKIFQRR